MNLPNKLDCCITLSWKGLPVTNKLTYFAYSNVTMKMKCCEYGPRGLYSQHFIFFVTYKLAQ
jgi:hypothetical protein